MPLYILTIFSLSKFEHSTLATRRQKAHSPVNSDICITTSSGIGTSSDISETRASFSTPKKGENATLCSSTTRLQTDEEKLNPHFLTCYFNTDETQLRLKSIATRAISQSNISATRLKRFVVPLPSLEEQVEIVGKAKALERKLSIHRRKREVLQALFRTLLHQLMTAQIRVNNLDLNEVEEVAAA